jgi:Peptidase M50B-like
MTSRATLNALLASAALSVLLYLLPLWIPATRFLAWPLMLLSTLAHELGHGVAALIAGGWFDTLRMYADGSGVATTRSNGSNWMQAWIAAGGPLGPPLTALALFIAARRASFARAALAVVAAILLAVLIFRARNAFGIVYIALLATLLAAIAWRSSAQAAQAVVCFLAIQLSLAAFSRADYLFTAQAQTSVGVMPSDTALIASALWLPYWFWGSILALISLAVLAGGIALYAKALRGSLSHR